MTIEPPPDDRIPELYADGVFDIGFGNGMVRIDLFSLSALRKDANGQPLPAIRQRVVMSLPGFLASLSALEGMRQRLEAAGVLPPNSGPGPGAPVSAPPAAPAFHSPVQAPIQPATSSPATPATSPGRPRSPNFG
ncbi:hypothetical protein J2848_005842 [Azospirillum lipoferum]|uniref:DUF3467 domain-containing protein n=1 Tax=Azospirillum lipoferum TaxID=193 RepID=A0A5A9GHG6_AZOLI|nr:MULTISPECIES: hypothetical protein [Azospirillum]KAA0593803.1 hypothetical protein FZ942_23255 [Azospirillum lipoferum]MCP1614139.1 hypothetical protein [Azospirillum lipoferum]MDW5536825.1 hypothetical protein [Azospirillum sp. NL1]